MRKGWPIRRMWRWSSRRERAQKHSSIESHRFQLACRFVQCMQQRRNEAMKMAMLTVRNIPEGVHRALRARAARRGHSMEAEVREILASTVSPEGRVKLGSLLAEVGRQARLTDDEFAVFAKVRDKTPAHPVSFE